LADKHKLKTAAKVYKIYGPYLKVTNKLDPTKTTKLDYPTSLKTTGNFKLNSASINLYLLEPTQIGGSYKSNPKTSKSCQFPGCLATEGLEEHHFNPQVNLKRKNLTPFLKSLIAKKRKTVTLCEEHHNAIHRAKGKK
jgi:hypothetical protein